LEHLFYIATHNPYLDETASHPEAEKKQFMSSSTGMKHACGKVMNFTAHHPSFDLVDFRDPIGKRRLVAMLVASAVAHALIIAGIAKPDWLQPQDNLAPLKVSLAPRPAEAAMAPVLPPPSISHQPAASRPAVTRPQREIALERQPQSADLTRPLTAAELPPTIESAPVTRTPSFTVPQESIAPPTGRPRPDTVAIAEYSRIVSGLIAAHRQYPGIARIRGWQGTTLLEISVDQGGHIIATRVAKSSGHDVLDRQAQEMVSKADPLPLPPMPTAIREQVVMLQLPVLFTLTP
jgi:protein TonB